MRVHRLIAFAEKNGFVKTFVEGGFDETSKYENILVMDGDLQHPPNYIEHLVKKYFFKSVFFPSFNNFELLVFRSI